MEYGDRIDVTICCPPSVKTGMRDSDVRVTATSDNVVLDADEMAPI